MRRAALAALALWMGLGSAQAATLTPDGNIVLAGVSGRIDHMAADEARGHLFVAELGNGTVDVIDLATRKAVHRIEGLKEPQGIVYAPKANLIAVANGGDGTVRLYSGQDFKPRGVIQLGDDADNVRLDPRTGNLVVGYGNGALAVIDPASARKIRDIPLPGHPESFRLDGARVFINVPDASQIVVADLDSGKVTGHWKPDHLSSNFPLILDGAGHVAVVFRSPARLVLYDTATGKPVTAAETCGDSDDVFLDARRKRFYVSCGAGRIDVFAADGLKRLDSISTRWGARTSLFIPELDRLFLAERAGLLGSDANIAIFAPGD